MHRSSAPAKIRLFPDLVAGFRAGCFTSRDKDLLTKAFYTYVRPLLGYCSPVSPVRTTIISYLHVFCQLVVINADCRISMLTTIQQNISTVTGLSGYERVITYLSSILLCWGLVAEWLACPSPSTTLTTRVRILQFLQIHPSSRPSVYPAVHPFEAGKWVDDVSCRILAGEMAQWFECSLSQTSQWLSYTQSI
ncbi:hypothetical protein HELRODRAFT_165015 [Helobdella robusta]|uniref:Uncharacterized protein n=1 Tax=Helobdella robusta TaxID=6412 RepID=T1EW49_HELRO|nr:hypothetical protein HELRODRAFT_165015 [Helobdella robusta]ESN92884.1 hypothetical protein HELRODRAFT_165015 [Helobdella robusta]